MKYIEIRENIGYLSNAISHFVEIRKNNKQIVIGCGSYKIAQAVVADELRKGSK